MVEIPDLAYGRFVGVSRPMRKVYELIRKISEADCGVMIFGESGTGKELVARAIHDSSARKNAPFVPVDSSALVPTLIESELFGFVRGSFTGATDSKHGLLEAAHKGTAFLDEIADLPLHLQGKLLRALQEGEVRRVGSTERVKIDVRIIAATNRNLEAAVLQGDFRKDLYYRLNVVSLSLPPLRERKRDIPLLAAHFLKSFRRPGRPQLTLDEEGLNTLMAYDWPGNVRELENCIERAVVLATGPIVRRIDISPGTAPQKHSLLTEGEPVLPLSELERLAILQAIARAHGDKVRAAKMLGIGKTTLYRKLRVYRLLPEAGS